jgi:subfamily B ATP-binding cassette protein MsbA
MKIPPHFRRALAMFQPYKGRLALAFIGMILTASTEPMLPAVLRQLLDRGFVGKPNLQLWMVPAAVIGIFVLRGFSTFLTSYMMTWVTSMLLNAMRAQMFARVLDVPAAFYAAHSVGKVINSMMFESQQVIDMVKNVLTSLVRDTLTVIVLLAFLIWLNWRLTIITLVLLPLTTMVVRMTGKRVRKLTREYLEINAELTQVIEETTRANQVIKIFGGQKYENDRFEVRAGRLRRYSMRMASTLASTVPITQIMAACAVAAVIVIALIQSSRGEATVGDFVSFIAAMLMLLTPLKRLAEVNGPLQRGMAASEAVYGLIDAAPERTSGRPLAGRARGMVEFDHVSFSYPGQMQRALSGINLTIMPGETVAFVGMSGGGKSTLVSLVPNFFSVSGGEIRLDGQPIEDISLPSLRAQIAMVSQSVVLFDDTVTANIAYGDPQPDLARVEAAMRAAYLADVVKQLPQGLDTVIGDNGNRLSGGQRQRLAIARAIYKDAPILILDEATSALDTESERAVQSALDRLMQGRTTLVIAHRLSTIERADRIVVLVGGEIVEVGSHAQLLEKNGAYASLYHLQFAEEAPEPEPAPAPAPARHSASL